MAVATATKIETTTTKIEEEYEEVKVKIFPFSKQERVVLESENKFLLGRKEGHPKLLGEEVGWFIFGGTIFFSGGRTNVGGLDLIMARIVS